jgi:hypothetical protein
MARNVTTRPGAAGHHDARVDWRPMDPSTPFAHASEAEMARILDFYAVRWEYEPDTFPILWNLDGMVVESFSPDFYLPELDLYLELTTLRQKLVRKKNRKLRRLRELYPSINIKLFYARDFRALMLKYGQVALAEGLSGSLGQVKAPYGETVSVATDDGSVPVPPIVTPLAALAQAQIVPSASTVAGRRPRRPRRPSTLPVVRAGADDAPVVEA